ncbi:MAG TPA: NifB/NifX family molybdenum-iron cluster-binding protein [Candidatus Eremiobacteraeota bacterium]|nr:MAG: hypothetical protein BWY64_00486 [bacterium ADurb.Bin363]HPZ07096.1 NifB/NifX family molybdenum-iron cluster-binding protein [Candidatus Eremiobacteraeota bacterium]
MFIGISIFNKRLSPLFDTSQNLLIVKLDGSQEKGREICSFGFLSPVKKMEKLIEKNINVLICGAISNSFIYPLVKANIRVIPNLCGEYEEILETFKENEISLDKFLMPGCCKKRKYNCHRHRHGRNN